MTMPNENSSSEFKNFPNWIVGPRTGPTERMKHSMIFHKYKLCFPQVRMNNAKQGAYLAR
jgi:hypothetical protein